MTFPTTKSGVVHPSDPKSRAGRLRVRIPSSAFFFFFFFVMRELGPDKLRCEAKLFANVGDVIALKGYYMQTLAKSFWNEITVLE